MGVSLLFQRAFSFWELVQSTMQRSFQLLSSKRREREEKKGRRPNFVELRNETFPQKKRKLVSYLIWLVNSAICLHMTWLRVFDLLRQKNWEISKETSSLEKCWLLTKVSGSWQRFNSQNFLSSNQNANFSLSKWKFIQK